MIKMVGGGEWMCVTSFSMVTDSPYILKMLLELYTSLQRHLVRFMSSFMFFFFPRMLLVCVCVFRKRLVVFLLERKTMISIQSIFLTKLVCLADFTCIILTNPLCLTDLIDFTCAS